MRITLFINTFIFLLLSNSSFASGNAADTLLKECIKETYSYWSMHHDELSIDWYTHQDFKNDSLQPLILIMHGGSFMTGSKTSDYCLKFASDWTKKGYQVVSVQYRLTLKGKSFHCDLPKEKKLDTFKEATYDLWQATQKVLSMQKEKCIDPEKIILAGVSAGAEAVLNAAYMPKHMYNLPHILNGNFKYAAVISYAGALADTNWITQETAIPTLLFHGSCDQYVPHRTATHHYCAENTPGALMLSGSVDIATRLDNLNTSYYLYLECESGHGVCKTPIWNQFEETYSFLHEVVINRTFEQSFKLNTNKTWKCKSIREVLCD